MALPNWLMAAPLPALAADERGSRRWAFASIALYVVASLAYGLLSDAPWDDDCVLRYFNARDAFAHPAHFFNSWNRPLFMVLFAPTAQLGRTAMTIQLIAIAAWAGWLLYRALVRLGASQAHWVLPVFFFQTFYFSVSRNFLTEPLAVAVICGGLHALVHRRWLLFAVLGGLLPMARLELVALLPFWALALMQAKQWRPMLALGAPVLLLMGLGYLIAHPDDPLWLVNETLGREGANRYGHRDLWHYFQRFEYVVGPVVFYFLVVGLLERLWRRRIDVFILVQGLAILGLYVLFSTKLNVGNSAGFLRNLIPLAPFVAWLAYEGMLLWSGLATAPMRAVAEKRAAREAAGDPEREARWQRGARIRQLLFGALATGAAWLWFSKHLEGHHRISATVDHWPAFICMALLAVGALLVLLRRKAAHPQRIATIALGLAGAGALAFDLATERPDAHLNGERRLITRFTGFYADSYLHELPIHANHRWFFWTRHLGYPDPKRYLPLTKAALDTARAHELALWENHYSHRLQGDQQLDDLYKRKDLVELAHAVSDDHRAVVGLFQKLGPDGRDADSLRARFMRAFPDNVYAHYALQQEHARAKRFDLALDEARRMVALDSNYIEGHLAEGQGLFDMARYPEAIACFERVLRKDPKLRTMHYSIALCRLRQGDNPGAVKQVKRLLAKERKMKEAYELLGVAYFNQQKFDSATTAFSEYIRLDKAAINGWLNRASSRARQGLAQSALDDFEQVLARDPSNRTALINKGSLLINLGRRAEGCQLLSAMAAAGDAGAAQQAAVLCGR